MRVRPVPGQDPHGVFPCLLIRAVNPEIQTLHVIIQHNSSTGGNNEKCAQCFDCMCFSSMALVFKLRS